MDGWCTDPFHREKSVASCDAGRLSGQLRTSTTHLRIKLATITTRNIVATMPRTSRIRWNTNHSGPTRGICSFLRSLRAISIDNRFHSWRGARIAEINSRNTGMPIRMPPTTRECVEKIAPPVANETQQITIDQASTGLTFLSFGDSDIQHSACTYINSKRVRVFRYGSNPAPQSTVKCPFE